MLKATVHGLSLFAYIFLAGRGLQAGESTVHGVPLPGGGRQRVLYGLPAMPFGTLVMLPGGAGDIGIGEDGDLEHGKNFVIRTRDLWIARGYAVVIPTPSKAETCAV